MSESVYLGDSVYAEEEQEGVLVLYAKNLKDADGKMQVSDVIFLHPETLCSLQRYLATRKVRDLLESK